MGTAQPDLFEHAGQGREARERALLDQLIAATRLYSTADAVKELLAFTARLRAFAPYNAMLLHIQKPGLTYAATAWDWAERFGRRPKEGARPLVVLRTMGPVDFVFDVLDTEGRDLPPAAFVFPTLGNLSEARLAEMKRPAAKEGIEIIALSSGDSQAGWIRAVRAASFTEKGTYRVALNASHDVPTRFVTLAHELAHLFLGHLGQDPKRNVPDRRHRSHAHREVEAEMTAWLVAQRSGVKPRSESYLAGYQGAIPDIDLYAVMRSANAVETAMGTSAAALRRKKT
jgi:hypothetical protein